MQLPDPRSDQPRPQRLGADDLAQLLRFYLYSDTTSALVPLVIAQAHGGQYAAVLAQSRIVVGDVAEHLSNGMAVSVLWTEDADLLEDQPQDTATLLVAAWCPWRAPPVRSGRIAAAPPVFTNRCARTFRCWCCRASSIW